MAKIQFKAKQAITEVAGKPIGELTKEELIEFLNLMLNHYESKIKELNKIISQCKGIHA